MFAFVAGFVVGAALLVAAVHFSIFDKVKSFVASLKK